MAYTDTQTRSTIAAYFSTQSQAHTAVEELRDAGFTADQVGMAGRANTGNPMTGTPVTATPVTDAPASSAHATTTNHESTWSKIKNFFEGNEPEPYADEKRRGDVVSHEITSEGGYGTEGYNDSEYDATDVHGSLAGLSLPEEHSRYFGHRFGRGEDGAIVTVQPNGRDREAEEILSRNGGDLGEGAEGYSYDEAETPATSGAQRIQLLGEVLRVHKERIGAGEVRLRKEVLTEQQTIQVPVSREELVVERVAGDNLTPVSGTIGSDSEIRIPLSQEVASADKQTVVREQVEVGKRRVEGVQDVNSEVRHEELRIEDSKGNKNY